MSIDALQGFSTEGYSNYPLFLKNHVQLLIYLEDSTRTNIHENILKRLLSEEIKFWNIKITHGKEELAKTFEETSKRASCPCLFIADMDFDELLDKPMVQAPNFIYLKRYCIENYLVDSCSGAFFVNGREAAGLEECFRRLNFDAWLAEVSNQYRPLILLFALAQTLELDSIENCGAGAERFIRDDSWEVDSSKLSSYQGRVMGACKNVIGLELALKELDRKIDRVYGKEVWRVIPGKQLLTVFIRYLLDFVDKKSHPNHDDFLNAASMRCSLEELHYIRDRAISIATASTKPRRHMALLIMLLDLFVKARKKQSAREKGARQKRQGQYSGHSLFRA